METRIQEINKIIKSSPWMDMYIYDYSRDTLILAGSEDFLYYHNLEIHFKEVFAVEINSLFKVDTEKEFLQIVEPNAEMGGYLNNKFKIEIGNIIFQMFSEGDQIFHVVAKDIDYIHKTVKYFDE